MIEKQEEGKVLGGLPKNVAFGLSWIAFPFGIVVLCIERKNLSKADRQQMVSIFCLEAVAYILAFLAGFFGAFQNTVCYIIAALFGILALVPFVFWLIAMINAFCGNHFHVPLAYNLAGKFVKDEVE